MMRPSRSRRGVSLIEIVVVVAIISILAAIGAGLIKDTLPTWRAREGAYSFAANLNRVRERAMNENVEYRSLITVYDNVPADGVGAGMYVLQRGDSPSNSTTWDTLPTDMATGGADGDGLVDISPGGKDELAGVGIEQPAFAGTTSGTFGYPISFNGAGMVTNPASDFTCDINWDGVPDGYICVTFLNDRALRAGQRESFTAIVSRAGLTRVIAGTNVDVGAPAGVSNASAIEGSSSGTGFAPGGTGDPGSGSGGPETGGGEDTGGGDAGGALPT